MFDITRKEALELFDDCEEFTKTGINSIDSKLRKKAELAFNEVTITAQHMRIISEVVYQTLANEYIVSVTAMKEGNKP